MAKIWPVYEGRNPIVGGPWADIPPLTAVSLFELRPEDRTWELATIPRFGDQANNLWFAGYKHIVVEIGPGEGKRAGWKPGFYKSKIKPADAFYRLIEQALVTKLGDDNVVRVKIEPATDSQGQDALKITVVVTPDALPTLKSGAALTALVELQKRLRDMRDERTPIVQYVTEPDLAQDDGP